MGTAGKDAYDREQDRIYDARAQEGKDIQSNISNMPPNQVRDLFQTFKGLQKALDQIPMTREQRDLFDAYMKNIQTLKGTK